MGGSLQGIFTPSPALEGRTVQTQVDFAFIFTVTGSLPTPGISSTAYYIKWLYTAISFPTEPEDSLVPFSFPRQAQQFLMYYLLFTPQHDLGLQFQETEIMLKF